MAAIRGFTYRGRGARSQDALSSVAYRAMRTGHYRAFRAMTEPYFAAFAAVNKELSCWGVPRNATA